MSTRLWWMYFEMGTNNFFGGVRPRSGSAASNDMSEKTVDKWDGWTDVYYIFNAFNLKIVL